jgi:hypothetical protein
VEKLTPFRIKRRAQMGDRISKNFMREKLQRIFQFTVLIGLASFPLASTFAGWKTPPPNYPFRVIFDIDGVLAYSYAIGDAAKVDLTGKVTVTSGKRVYVLYDDAAALIQDLLDIPRAEVGFFSFGQPERNLPLLEGMVLPRGRNGATTAKDAAFITYSWPEATSADKKNLSAMATLNSGDPYFWSADKKDLRHAVPWVELPNTILVDNSAKKVFRGQEGNLLLVDDQWRDKPTQIREVFERLFEKMAATGKPPAELLFDMQFERRGKDLIFRQDGRILYTPPAECLKLLNPVEPN